MNKTLVFILGLLTGAAAGSAGTYFLVKQRCEDRAAEEIEMYAEHCEERIRRYAEKDNSEEESDEEASEMVDDSEEDEEIKNNEGVKKYHYYNNENNGMTVNQLFEKEDKTVTAEEIKKKWEEEDSKAGISEIGEEDFLNDEDFDKQTIDYFFEGDKENAYWGYGTDNQTLVEAKFGKPLKGLIGNAYAWLIDYTDESGIGAVYFRNSEMNTDFEVIIHDSTGFMDRDGD